MAGTIRVDTGAVHGAASQIYSLSGEYSSGAGAGRGVVADAAAGAAHADAQEAIHAFWSRYEQVLTQLAHLSSAFASGLHHAADAYAAADATASADFH